MTRNLLSTLILWIVCSILVLFCFVIAASAQGDATRPAHLGFIFPLSTNGVDAAKFSNGFSFHVLAGLSRQEEAFCLSGISSLVRENATGVMISGLYNRTGREARGVQIAGLINNVGKDAKGVQLAGLANLSGNACGAQIAGFSNIADRADLQVAGFINVSHDTKNQVAGFINIAKKVSGVQVAGFINIAEESDYPIGLINIIKNGEKQLGVSIDETGTSLLSFRSGGRILYGILSAGYNFKNDQARYVLEGGMGAHFQVNKYFRINMEITTAALTDFQYNTYMKSTTRLLASLKIANHIELFAGPSFNYLGYERGQADIRDDHYLWRECDYNHFNGLYFGATGGIQINL